MKRWIWVGLGCLIGSVGAWAQNTNDPQQAEVEVEFSVYASQPQLLKRTFVLDPETGPQEIDFRTGGTFRVYRYKGPQVMTFFDYTGTYGAKEGGFRIAPKAQVAIPQGAERVLLFFAPKRAGESGLPFRVMAMPFDDKAFPYQSVMIFNGSGQTLWMHAGSRMVPLRSGPSGVFSVGEEGASFQFYYEVGGKRLRVFNQAYACADNERIFILILPSLNESKPGDVRIQYFKERKRLNETAEMKKEQAKETKTSTARIGEFAK